MKKIGEFLLGGVIVWTILGLIHQYSGLIGIGITLIALLFLCFSDDEPKSIEDD